MANKTIAKKKRVIKSGSGTNAKGPTRGGKGKNDCKAPTEAAAYLEQWEQNNENELSTWKFNKNTQSWLIRHMYEADKVSKSSFNLLLRYLEGLKGESARTRIKTEASRRAIRYRQHQAKGSEKADFDTKTEDSGVESKTSISSSNFDEGAVDEEERWKNLSEHDKRKEYKRARKVLESILAK